MSRRSVILIATAGLGLSACSSTLEPQFQFSSGESIQVTGDLEVEGGFRSVTVFGRVTLPCNDYVFDPVERVDGFDISLRVRGASGINCASQPPSEFKFSAVWTSLPSGTYTLTVVYQLDNDPDIVAADTTVGVL